MLRQAILSSAVAFAAYSAVLGCESWPVVHAATMTVAVLLAIMLYSLGMFSLSWYRIKMSLLGMKHLTTLCAEDKEACVEAYAFLPRHAGW